MDPLTHTRHTPSARFPALSLFPNPKDKGACARFRLARKRRGPSHTMPSMPAAGNTAVWQEIVSVRRHFNQLSALVLQQSQLMTELLSAHARTGAVPPCLCPSSLVATAAAGDSRDVVLAAPRPSDTVIADATLGPSVPGVSALPQADPIAGSTPVYLSTSVSGKLDNSLSSPAVSPAPPSHSSSRRKADDSLPKLRGLFNRKNTKGG
ncbi:hypothetical protein FB45DRAFT_940306 [Roridomyces roridus]|uniref:Uncharacterized protein n=1 Tax=Roridomyces roridus TaxID=1738132 RepID=A0AAD7FCX0_9AGAR|nr:hypothetical protein FB45DRAFT_940306 [Roridomyces roridus]